MTGGTHSTTATTLHARKPEHRGAVREQHRDDEAGPRTTGGSDAADGM